MKQYIDKAEEINNPLKRELCQLSARIRANKNFQIRKSDFYEPWDASDEFIKEAMDSFYYDLSYIRSKLEYLIKTL